MTTSKALGYRFPAEWEPQEAVWFAWPLREELWGGRYTAVREQMVRLYAIASRFQVVRVLCPAEHHRELQEAVKAAGGAVELFDYRTDDVWCRDFCPISLISEDGSESVLTDWRYNAWGGKFPDQQRDNGAAAWIAAATGKRRFVYDMILEGGAVESNGAGQLLTTESVLLNPNRNPEMDRAAIEANLIAGLGIDEVLWLKDGLDGDDTDGHIDNLARFFSPDGILLAEARNTEDPDYEPLLENARRIQNFRTKSGDPFASVQLPLPDPVRYDGRRLTASYLNFLVLNGGVIVPNFAQARNDAEAMEIIGDCFPGREIVGLDCRDIAIEGGAIHCLSQNQPAVD